MSAKNRKMEELKQLKTEAEQGALSGTSASAAGSTLPAWLWWGLGVLLGCLSIVVLSSRYIEEKKLAARETRLGIQEIFLADYTAKEKELKQQVEELVLRKEALQEGVNGLQTELSAGSEVIAEYRVIKQEHKALSDSIAELQKQNELSSAEQGTLDRTVGQLRSEHSALLTSYTNRTEQLREVQAAITSAENNLKRVNGTLAAKSEDLAAANQNLRLIKDQVDARKQALAEAENRETQSKLSLAKTDEQNAALAKQLEDRTRELVQTKNELAQAAEKKTAMEKDLYALKSETVTYESVKQSMDQVKKDLANTEERLASLNKQISLAETRLAETRKDLAETSAKASDAKARLTDMEGKVAAEQLRLKQMQSSVAAASSGTIVTPQ